MQLFLVGMPASGKSTLGRALARKFRLPFYDLDEEIVRTEGSPIPSLFSVKGEEYFRHAEAKILRSITTSVDGFVMATGGGTPCFHNSMEYMLEKGTVVFLHVSLETLAQRLKGKEMDARPLVKAMEGDSFMEGLQAKWNTRKGYYQQAHIVAEEFETNSDLLEKKITDFIKNMQ